MTVIYFNNYNKFICNDQRINENLLKLSNENLIVKSIIKTTETTLSNSFILIHNLNHELIYQSKMFNKLCSNNLLLGDYEFESKFGIENYFNLQKKMLNYSSIQNFTAILELPQFTHIAGLQLMGSIMPLNTECGNIAGFITILTPTYPQNFCNLKNILLNNQCECTLLSTLSKQEYCMLYLIGKNLSQSEISTKLSVSKGYISKTVSTKITKKLNCINSLDLIKFIGKYSLLNLLPLFGIYEILPFITN